MKGKCKCNPILAPLTLMLLLLLAQPVGLRAGGVKLIKTVQKTFRLNDSETLEVRNKYGKVDVKTWSKDYVSVHVTITAFGPTEVVAQSRLEEVSIVETHKPAGLLLESRTRYDKELRLDKKGVTVSYEISLPASNPIKVENQFGNVFIADRRGDVSLTLSNGNVVLGRLQGTQNEIKTSFGQTDLSYISGGKLECAYGHVLIGEAGDLILKSDGAEVKIDEVKKLNLLVNLGNIEIDRGHEIKGKYSSAHFHLGRLEQSLDMQVKYAASFELESIAPQFQLINLEVSYCPVDLGFDPEAQFSLNAEVKFGKLRYEARTVSMTILEDEVEGNSSTYLGRFGMQKNPKSRVVIKSNYSNVNIRQ